MKKDQLISAIADKADISKEAAGKTLDALIDVLSEALKNNEEVTLVGFGKFMVRERAARTGRNPKTGEPLNIAASKTPSFKAGKALKDAIN